MHGDSIFMRKKKFLYAKGKEVRCQNVFPLIDSILNAEVLGVHSWIVTTGSCQVWNNYSLERMMARKCFHKSGVLKMSLGLAQTCQVGREKMHSG